MHAVMSGNFRFINDWQACALWRAGTDPGPTVGRPSHLYESQPAGLMKGGAVTCCAGWIYGAEILQNSPVGVLTVGKSSALLMRIAPTYFQGG